LAVAVSQRRISPLGPPAARLPEAKVLPSRVIARQEITFGWSVRMVRALEMTTGGVAGSVFVGIGSVLVAIDPVLVAIGSVLGDGATGLALRSPERATPAIPPRINTATPPPISPQRRTGRPSFGFLFPRARLGCFRCVSGSSSVVSSTRAGNFLTAGRVGSLALFARCETCTPGEDRVAD
jgi:hypothetical protein